MMEAEAVVAQGTLKATCSRDELTRALGIVSRGVSTRTTVQILAGILLQASGEKLDLAATDMELSLRTSLEAQVEAEGSVVVPGLRPTGCTPTTRKTSRGSRTRLLGIATRSTVRCCWRPSRGSAAPRRGTS